MTDTKCLMAYQFPACAEQMLCVRQKLREALSSCCQSDEVMNGVVLAVGEACMNIIQHAYGEQDRGDILLELELRSEPEKANVATTCKRQLVCRLTDFAKHETHEGEMQSRPLDEIRPGGLGCHIINQVMDDVRLLDRPAKGGNVLELCKRLDA